MHRIGTGYDIHRLEAGRPLILGGVEIPFGKGLLGHSDADALLHAVCDAMLGAAGLGDIGGHFPDTDPRFKGISSIVLLQETVNRVREQGFDILNLDATVLAEMPKLGPYRETMKQRISDAAALPPERINIKAKTMEGIGAVGAGEAIAAMCVVLLKENNDGD